MSSLNITWWNSIRLFTVVTRLLMMGCALYQPEHAIERYVRWYDCLQDKLTASYKGPSIHFFRYWCGVDWGEDGVEKHLRWNIWIIHQRKSGYVSEDHKEPYAIVSPTNTLLDIFCYDRRFVWLCEWTNHVSNLCDTSSQGLSFESWMYIKCLGSHHGNKETITSLTGFSIVLSWRVETQTWSIGGRRYWWWRK